MTASPERPGALDWTAADLREWRGRLRWTQRRAAEALLFHLEAYKRLECGTRAVGARVRRPCILTEREHVRTMFSASGSPGTRQVFATPDRVLARLDALHAEAPGTRRATRWRGSDRCGVAASEACGIFLTGPYGRSAATGFHRTREPCSMVRSGAFC